MPPNRYKLLYQVEKNLASEWKTNFCGFISAWWNAPNCAWSRASFLLGGDDEPKHLCNHFFCQIASSFITPLRFKSTRWTYRQGTLGGRAADLCTSWPGCSACPWGISCARCPAWGCWASRRCHPCPRCSPWRLRLTACRWSAWSSWATGWAAAGWLRLEDPARQGRPSAPLDSYTGTVTTWVLCAYDDFILTGGPGGPIEPLSPLAPAGP